MPREPTGTVEYLAPKKGEPQGHYRVRITLPDGKRPWIPMKPGPKSPRAEALAREKAREYSDTARAANLTGEDFEMRISRATAAKAAATPKGISVADWFDKYYEWRESRPVGGESVSDARGRFKNWIAPTLGPLAMIEVTRDDVEAFVVKLDTAVGEKRIASKTTLNIFSDLRAAFNIATSGKEKSLRVLASNPVRDVAPPDQTPDQAKTFLRPDEVFRLLACALIPLDRRHVYAVAIYTALRQGELRALRVRDVDLDAMQITVAKTIKNGVEKQRTKTGRLRVVQIEPNLVPLLRVLMSGKEDTERLLQVRAHNRCAIYLRADLTLAGCTRDGLHSDDEMRQHLTFHNLRDTCLTHMAVRRDPPQDVQWRAGHTTAAMTEKYIAEARYHAGANFGTPLAPLPPSLLLPSEIGDRDDDGEPERLSTRTTAQDGPDVDVEATAESAAESSETPRADRLESSAAIVQPPTIANDRALTDQTSISDTDTKCVIAADRSDIGRFRFPAPPPRDLGFSGVPLLCRECMPRSVGSRPRSLRSVQGRPSECRHARARPGV